MATNVLSRRLLAVTVSASLGIFATAIATTPAFAKSKPKKHHHHTTTTLKKGKTTTSGKGAKTTLGATIKKLETSVKSHKTATFIATYKLSSTTKTDKTKTMVIAQEPPKSAFKVTSSIFLNTGTTSIFCTTGTTSSSDSSTTGTTSTTVFGSGPECFKSKTNDPLSSLVDLFSPTTALDFFNQADEQAAAKAAGVSISFSTGTYAGLKSKCVTVKASSAGANDGGKYCISQTGIMDFFTSGGSGATLVKFSSSVPSTTFTTPKGAKIVTEAKLGA